MTFASKLVNDFGNMFINSFYAFVLDGFIDLEVKVIPNKMNKHTYTVPLG